MKNLETLFLGQHFIHLEDVDSTNNFAAKMIKQTNVVSGTVILADNQHQGKGQSGNSWQVESGKNLTFSLILKPRLKIENQFLLSKITCLAIIDTLESYQIEAKIKWPNDILINKRKVSGILIENSLKGEMVHHSIIGIGLNIQQVFKKNMNAVSILEVTGKKVDLEETLRLLLKQLEKWILKLEKGLIKEIDQAYLNHLFQYNQKQLFEKEGAFVEGLILGVNSLGQLRVQIEEKEQLFQNKEIKFVLD